MNPLDLRPRSIGELLDVAVKLVTKNAKTILPISLLFTLVTSFIPMVVLLVALPDGAVVVNGDILVPDPGALDRYNIIGIIVLGAAALISFASFAPLYRAVVNGYLGRHEPFGVCLKKGLAQTGSVILLLILIGLVVAVPVLLVFAGFAVSDGLGAIAAIGAFVVLMVLMVRLSVSLPVLVAERFGPVTSFKRSFALTKTRGWSTFATLFLGGIVIGIVSAVLTSIFTKAAGGSTPTSKIVGEGIAEGVIGALVSTPFLIALVAAIYFDLRVRNEGFDIEVLASTLGDGAPPVAPHPRPASQGSVGLGEAASAYLRGDAATPSDPFASHPPQGPPPQQ